MLQGRLVAEAAEEEEEMSRCCLECCAVHWACCYGYCCCGVVLYQRPWEGEQGNDEGYFDLKNIDEEFVWAMALCVRDGRIWMEFDGDMRWRLDRCMRNGRWNDNIHDIMGLEEGLDFHDGV